MRENLTRENVFVREAGLKTQKYLPANFTGYTVVTHTVHKHKLIILVYIQVYVYTTMFTV